jgi:hypothetical protein
VSLCVRCASTVHQNHFLGIGNSFGFGFGPELGRGLSFCIGFCIGIRLGFCPAQLVTRETEGHPKGGAHGRAPGATLGRMPNVAPACAGIALVAFDSKQPKRFLWLLLTEGNPVGLCRFGQRK